MRIGNTQFKTSTKFSAMAPAELSDKALVQLIADKDKRALKLLYLRHHDRGRRFVMRFTGNGAISECRRRSEAQLDERSAAIIEDPSGTPAITMDKRERSDVLQRCLAKLTPLHREVINLIYYQGRKIEEVAQFTGAPIDTIRLACTMQGSAWPSCSQRPGSTGPGWRSDQALQGRVSCRREN